MAFCINCGQELAEGAKFCANCGTAAIDTNSNTKRKMVYDGELHKCPNCGELLGSFSQVCPACGIELRGTKASDAVTLFTSKLEAAKTEDNRIGQATGPYNLQVLQQMIMNGQVTVDSLVWKTGMANWVKAKEADDLKGLFAPPVPPVE